MAMVAAGFTGSEAEELRRAFGFKRSERRMAEVEVKLREGMAGRGVTRRAARENVHQTTSFAPHRVPGGGGGGTPPPPAPNRRGGAGQGRRPGGRPVGG